MLGQRYPLTPASDLQGTDDKMKYFTRPICIFAILVACAPAPEGELSAPVAPAAFDGAISSSASTNEVWWQSFRDPTLTQLMEVGFKQNLSIKLAVQRIKEAEANAVVAGAGALPQLSATSAGGRSSPGPVTGGSATASVGWLADVFGRNRSSRAQAAALRDAAWANADLARLALAGAIAEAYVDLRYYQARIALTKASRESRAKTAELVASSASLGAASNLDILRADQLVAVADAQLPALELGEITSFNRLATLLGQSTSAVSAIVRPGSQPVPRFRPSVGVPAQVLRDRPDVIIAERNYAAAAAAINVARADLYPSLSLTGTITRAAVKSGTGTTTWSFGPQVNLPIFSGGALRANLTGAESRAAQAHLEWQQTVLMAVEEVQNALAAYGRDGRNVAAQQKLVDISTETLDLARGSFAAGQGDFLSVLEAERTLLDARGGLTDASRLRAVNFIRLSVATGSGAKFIAP